MLYKLTLASFIAVAYAASVGAGTSAVNCPGTNSYCDCADDCGQSMCECAAAQVENCCDGRGQPLEGAPEPLPDNDGEWKTITTFEDSVTGEQVEWTAVTQATPSPVAQASPSPVVEEEVAEEEELENCEDACETNNNDWDTKCTWNTMCSGCSSCEEIETTYVSENCETVCETNNNDWDTKCTWQTKCSGCSSCEQIENCSNWSAARGPCQWPRGA